MIPYSYVSERGCLSILVNKLPFRGVSSLTRIVEGLESAVFCIAVSQ